MSELLGILCFLSFMLAVVAGVGHGIWLLSASVLRTLTGRRREPARPAEVGEDLIATCRQLDRLLRDGRISFETYDQVRDELDQDLDHRQTVVTRSTPPVVPSPASVQPAQPATVEEGEFVQAEVVEEAPVTHPPLATPPAQPVHQPIPEPEPAPPRRSMAGVFSTFMLEKNIRWGELLSGMLIVGSAIGLVLSLQAELKRTIPYFPALLFMLVTAAIHGVGSYTLRKWNLRSTSRGVLMIGLLLVPLNFLAASLITADSQPREVTDIWFLAAFTVGAFAFSAMSYFSCRSLFQQDWWMPAVPIMVASLAQPLINRAAPATGGLGWQLLAAIPLAGFLIGNGGAIRRVLRQPGSAAEDAERMLMTLCLSLFSSATAIGLLLARSGSAPAALDHLSVLLPLVAGLLIAAGLTIQRRCNDEKAGLLGITGTSIAILGGLMCAGALGLAWPSPEFVMLVSFINCLILATSAVRAGLPSHQIGAAANFGICATVSFHWILGHYGESGLATTPLQLLVSSTTTFALTIAAIVCFLNALFVPRLSSKKVRPQQSHLLGSGLVLAALSCLVAVTAGVASFISGTAVDLNLATGILFFYTSVGLAVGVWMGVRLVLRAGAGLLLIALLHAIVLNLPLRESLNWFLSDVWLATLFAVLVHAAVCGLLALLAWLSQRRGSADELSWASLISSGIALPLALWLHHSQSGLLAIELATICSVWLIGTILHRNEQELAVFQGLLFGTVSSTAAWLAIRLGVCDSSQDVSFVRVQLVVLTLVCLAWNALRFWSPPASACAQLIRRRPLSLDQSVLCGLVAVVLASAALAVAPGISAELAPDYSIMPPNEWLFAFGNSLWLPLGCLILTVATWHADRYSRTALVLLLLLGCSSSILAVLPAAEVVATASALRWSLSIFGLVVAVLLWRSKQLGDFWKWSRARLRPGDTEYSSQPLPASFTLLSLGLSITPVLLLITFAAARGIQELPFGGPNPISFFGKDSMLVEVSYGIPLMLIVTSLLSHAVQRHESKYAWCGTLIMLYLLVMGIVLFSLHDNSALLVRLVRVIQFTAIYAAGYGALWIALHHKIQGKTQRPAIDDPRLFAHVMIPGAMILFLGFVGIATIIEYPLRAQDLSQRIGGPIGYAALAATALLYGWYFREHLHKYIARLSAGSSTALLGTAAATVHASPPASWTAFRLLMLGSVGVAASAAILPWVATWRQKAPVGDAPKKTVSGLLPTSAAIFALYLACISVVEDPRPEWAVATVAGLLVLTSILVFRFGPALAYLGQLLIAVGVVFVGMAGWVRSPEWIQLLHGGLVATGMYGILWVVMEVDRQRGAGFLPPSRWPLYPRVAAIGVIIVQWLLTIGGLASQRYEYLPLGEGWFIDNPTGWLATATGGALAAALLWDRESRVRVAALFFWGLAFACLPALMALPQDVDLLPVASVSLAAYLAGWGWLWRKRIPTTRIAETLRINDANQIAERCQHWLVACMVILFAGLTLVQLEEIWNSEGRPERFISAMVPLLAAIGLAAIASSLQGKTVGVMSLLFCTVFGIYCSWADLPVGYDSGVWIQRLVRLMIVAAAATFLYGGQLSRLYRFSDQWLASIRTATMIVAALAVASLTGILSLEIVAFEPGIGVASIGLLEAAAVAIALIFMIAGLLVMALRPSQDPLSLSLAGRKGYVYLAQSVAALLILHLWLTSPWLFQLDLFRYWPYILMGVAFAGTGLAEVFRRRKVEVLADPLGATGIIISLVPAFLMWSVSSETDRSAVLLGLGILHLGVGIVRGSLLLGCSSILFGNLALWTFYTNFDQWSLLDRPQFWLIPPAASVLLAAQWSRARLAPWQLTLVRYGCIAVIYVSSTSEIFIAGIGDEIWPPMILASLSVLGVFAGMIIRVRAYLYLGTSFLFVSMVSMVMRAQQRLDHVWPWWAFGICLGTGILVMFGIFEKKRPELTAWTQKLNQWDG
jgi:hypothetical protein